ncbi:hypothetical protein UCRPC4_g01708 [Phaeomoniella chlamydospora]|uniref:Transcriptional regulatory protein n=1 Tax=Phaeomoniella chlamydospora TaxID=158046 RepID=A0A0G2ETC1_PHACM|nr:hypothetical protein UCRPC4_g01708 [Phaeomoniella chlamydospora]
MELSGHNRWSKIKHDKGANDAAKSKERSIISKDITLAVKQFGADPSFNPRLTHFLSIAKRAGFSKVSIENAILKGQGKSSSGAALEPVTIEAMLPGQVACIIDCLTDSKARLLGDLRHVITKWSGNVTSTAFLFDKKGRVVFEKKDGIGINEVMDPAIEAGAVDVSMDEEGRVIVDTETGDVNTVATELAKNLGLNVSSADIIYDPKEDMMVELEDGSEQAAKVERILDLVKEDSGVQEVYLNAK